MMTTSIYTTFTNPYLINSNNITITILPNNFNYNHPYLSINNPYLSINNPYLSINNPYLSINNPHNNSCEKSTQTNENEPNNNKPNNNKPNNIKPNNLIPIPSIPDFHDDNTKNLKNNFTEIKIIYDEMINGLDILCDFTNPEEEKIKKKYMELNEKLFNLD
jgi:hypothetical protein